MNKAENRISNPPITKTGHFTGPIIKNTIAMMAIPNLVIKLVEIIKWFFVMSKPTKKYPKPSTKAKIKKPYIQKRTSFVMVEKPKNAKNWGKIGANIAKTIQATIFQAPAKKNKNL